MTYSASYLTIYAMLDDQFIARDNIGFIRNYLAQTGLDLPSYARKLDEIEKKQTMTYASWWELLDELAEHDQQAALGVKVGSLINIEHCGLLGYLFQTSQDLNQALSCFLRFQRLLYGGSEARIELNQIGEACLKWDPEVGYSAKISDELLLSGIVSVVRSVLADSSFTPSSIYFPHAASDDDLKVYEAFFQCKVVCDHPMLIIAFSLEDLDKSLKGWDQNLHTLLNQQATYALDQVPQDDVFLMEIREHIARLLHEGLPEADALANKLHVSTRTLHRRLKDRGQLFRDILMGVRQAMAINYLDDPKLTHAEIALMLAYQDQSAFSRAFKSWFGKTPREYQKSL